MSAEDSTILIKAAIFSAVFVLTNFLAGYIPKKVTIFGKEQNIRLYILMFCIVFVAAILLYKNNYL